MFNLTISTACRRCGAKKPRKDGRQRKDDWLENVEAARTKRQGKRSPEPRGDWTEDVDSAKCMKAASRKAQEKAKRAAPAAEDAKIEARQAMYNFRAAQIGAKDHGGQTSDDRAARETENPGLVP